MAQKTRFLVSDVAPTGNVEFQIAGETYNFELVVGSLWFDTVAGRLKACTALPSTFDFADNGSAYLTDAGDGNVSVTTGASGFFTLVGPSGALTKFGYLTELTTIAAAATTDTTIEIPANSVLLGVSGYVHTVIPTATDFDLGISGATNRFANDIAVAATTAFPNIVSPAIYTTATKLRFTPQATPGAATGKVRLYVSYYTVTAPTS
jgi:hypothetical protein